MTSLEEKQLICTCKEKAQIIIELNVDCSSDSPNHAFQNQMLMHLN